jgi:hypothetical protein
MKIFKGGRIDAHDMRSTWPSAVTCVEADRSAYPGQLMINKLMVLYPK